jgi:guanylate kinase
MKMGPLIIVSGPSGVGKSTLVARLLADGGLPLRRAVTVTTRPSRPGERDGVDYYFHSPEWFEKAIQAGAFLEWAEVHGQRYGTLRAEVDDARKRGIGVILVIDVQGAEQVRRQRADALSIFLTLPRWELYEERIRGRGDEDEAAIARRLETARRELARHGEFDHEVVNDDLDRAVNRVRDVIAQRFGKGTSCSTN